MKLIPVKMRQIREERGFSKAELARRSKMHSGEVGMIESGRLIPYPVQLERLADALNIENPESLLEPLEVKNV